MNRPTTPRDLIVTSGTALLIVTVALIWLSATVGVVVRVFRWGCGC